ncbi:MAG: polysaccharide biosynthesis/export family protein [Bryobacterales bacterium]|nr:polysaccharide biosynthesis/export family protein [Bryobacterales bacterium]
MKWDVVLLSAFIGIGSLQAQAPSAGVAAGNLPAQKIGPNDLLAVSVYGAPEFTRSVRVDDSGKLSLPMVREQLHAAGKLPMELERSIAEALRKGEILVDPVVTVTIVEYFSRPISVMGAVHKPTTFQAVGPVSLLDAVTRAEGLSQDAGPEILVTRRQRGETDNDLSLVQRIPVKGLVDAADPEFNIALHGGEEIRVPEAGKIYVVGNVKKPGAYTAGDATDTTVLKLLAMSEGLAPYASKNAYIFRREASTGAKNEIPLQLSRIMQRKSPDVPLLSNDILYIPDNRGKRIGLTALERIVGFGSATASGVLIWGVAR